MARFKTKTSAHGQPGGAGAGRSPTTLKVLKVQAGDTDTMKTTILDKRKIYISENQAKVIKDKYLRDDNSVEDLFERVAHNISLSELVFHPDAEKWGVFTGVNFRTAESAADGGCAWLREKG